MTGAWLGRDVRSIKFDFGCEDKLYDADGVEIVLVPGVGIRPAPCKHEWRLISEREQRCFVDPVAPGSVFTEETVPVMVETTVRRWYCVHCRTIEETSG